MLTQPFYFGRQNRLFGIVDAPATGATRESGILICQPLGPEYFRCHRACRQLAVHLVRAGFTVMRFDYDGCGDSAGESHEVGFDSWLDDVAAAIDRMHEYSRSVCVIGLRLGASLAVLAGTRRGDIERMVLWELVVSGRDYVREMRAQHSQYADRLAGQDDEADSSGLSSDVTEILGVPFAAATIAAIEGLDMRRLTSAPAASVLILNNAKDGEADLLRPGFERSVGVETMLVQERSAWLAEPAVVPVESIEVIVRWASRVAR